MQKNQFTAEITDVKIIYNTLKAISFNEFAMVRPMEEGLKITVEDSKSCETSVYLPDTIFNSYKVQPNEDIRFKISLKVFTEILHIFGDEGVPTLKLNYVGESSPLYLIMKHSEENITVDGQLSTMSVDNFQDVILSEECNVNQVVFSGEDFVNYLSDLDSHADDFELEITQNPPLFRISTTSIMGESKMEIPKSCEIINLFECKADFKSKYAFSNLKQILKVMAYASKISISTGESGLLGLQLIIKSQDRQLYVEYYMMPLFETD